MGYGISLHRFVDGEPETLDEPVAREVLAHHAANADQDAEEILIRAGDGGEAEVTLSADGISVHRFPSGGVLDIVAELADRLGAAIVAPDCVLVSSDEQLADLPDGLRDMATVVAMTGPALQGALEG
ncbi:hypothetical protein E2C00_28460 [Streptomyces sp. WAC05374]|uniref:hypothetical protein n=1 Tax=Streptomyces sp. WAC05374 TaxID=2487420 RepID=UPI000F86B75E|nr:hypothetical protein [Streptomyces sp. WAC05374]RST10976.1 hypothetical protein EF905_26160 [Streptomyces sp. WAC05374]TDF41068.1 hypothetical protein E2B92_22920 [Streptomyces sp. WAC05374]TDF49773.1 hypothetical protein E2C00_28460 [Streptomyces sp. WAC05374]TDF51338.1 hypothetical protein E2C02_23640 [Streptomyces sp. WAC05374]